MPRTSSIARWADRIAEGGWLLSLLLIPSYFNLLSSRHFEPDKATTLRSLVLLIAAASLIGWVERRAARVPASADAGGRHRWLQLPLALPVVLYALVYIFATLVSIAPAVSFWGSYQRLQGTYTNLAYVALGALVALGLRRRAQLDRLVAILILGSVPAVGYGLIQHFQADPLPWGGDVVTRVASTMGNSIFVAAYMIMVLPYALARGIGAIRASRISSDTVTDDAVARDAWLWGVGYGLTLVSALPLAYGAVAFGAVVRTSDLRYWWIYPAALVVCAALFILPTLQAHRGAPRGLLALPLLSTIGYVLLLGFAFVLGQNGGGQVVQAQPARGGLEWPLWLGAAVLLALAGYAACAVAPTLGAQRARPLLILQGIGALAIAALLLLTIAFTQSRGPWIGGGFGLFVFFTLLLLTAARRARLRNDPRARLWRGLLVAEVFVALAIGGFLVVFNTSDAQVFTQLRQSPYIGRMGRLLEVDSGTGLVRRLIWFGDAQGKGAVGLIGSDPLRALIGYGPESMFVAYNPFYPPSLANIEARGASPDRSHQMYLDELITRGVVGLASYLFVIGSFFLLVRRVLRDATERDDQLLAIASASAVAAFAVEGLTGIPIVSTLMLLWISFALMVAVARIATLAPAPAPAPVVPVVPQLAARGNRRQISSAARRTAGGNTAAPPAAEQGRGGVYALYAAIGVLTLAIAWSTNGDNVYADMLFQRGQGYTERANATIDDQVTGASYYLDAIRLEPDQDFYYLNLGRSMLTVVSGLVQDGRTDLGSASADSRLENLLSLQGPQALASYVGRQTPMQLLAYARIALERARDLAPRNKDHHANIARMYNFWYQVEGQSDKSLMDRSVAAYAQASALAPQDVSILNEYAAAVARSGDTARALALLERSQQLDPKYTDTALRIADALRLQGDFDGATARWVAILATNPHALDTQIGPVINALRDRPDLLGQLAVAYRAQIAKTPDDVGLYAALGRVADRAGDLPTAVDAFGTVVRLQPENLEAHQYYTLVLSDSQRYDDAIRAANDLLTRAQQRGVAAEDVQAIQGLITLFEQLRG